MITIATLFWQANEKSFSFSSMYDESWVEKLYQGFARNISPGTQWRFVCYTDRGREFRWPIEQVRLKSDKPSYADCIQPYEMGVPMILVGLDTIVTGSIDHLIDYCLTEKVIALPRDPFNKEQACNGVALVPSGMAHVALDHKGQNDMEWMRSHPHQFIDDLFPKQVVSWKGHVERHGLGDARIVYFHGDQKPHQLKDNPIIKKNW